MNDLRNENPPIRIMTPRIVGLMNKIGFTNLSEEQIKEYTKSYSIRFNPKYLSMQESRDSRAL